MARQVRQKHEGDRENHEAEQGAQKGMPARVTPSVPAGRDQQAGQSRRRHNPRPSAVRCSIRLASASPRCQALKAKKI